MDRKRIHLVLLVLAGAALLPGPPAGAVELVAITDRGELLHFSDSNPREMMRRDLQGSGLPLVGIDVRPADGRLYGVDTAGGIFAIDLATAVAVFQARLSIPLAPAPAYLVDFNPVTDRLHVIGANGQNLRVDVETGRTESGPAIRAAGGGTALRIAGGAHTNAIRGAATTQLYVIDSANGIYARLGPGDDGALQPVTHVPGIGADAADIASDGTREQGYSVLNNILHVFDPATGAGSAVQAIGTGATGRAGRIIDIAVRPPPR